MRETKTSEAVSLRTYAREYWKYYQMAKTNNPELAKKAKDMSDYIDFLTEVFKKNKSESFFKHPLTKIVFDDLFMNSDDSFL